jgi:hypothetical protein
LFVIGRSVGANSAATVSDLRVPATPHWFCRTTPLEVPVNWASNPAKNPVELARQAEIDKENATAPAGVHREQMGNFRDEEPDAA